MKKVLVTGGAGFIGSAIVKKLVEKNYSVRVFDNEWRGKSSRLKGISKNIEYIKGDIRDFDRVNKSMKGIDSVIHLAYINGTKFFYEKPELVLSVGIRGMLNVLDAAKANGVPDLFLASSSEVYQTPPTIPTPEDVPYIIPSAFNPRYSYGGGKIISELMLIQMGKQFLKRAVIFRPHNVYGPDMGNEHVIPELFGKISKLKNKKEITLQIQGTGQETRSFIYIDDFVDAFMTIFTKGKNQEIYNIGTSEEIKMLDLVKLMGKVTSKNIKVKTTPLQKGSVLRRCPDITKIKKLGFSPKVSLIDGLSKTNLWYNS
jgi:nucleoside-diphosphate-sugar epimerase